LTVRRLLTICRLTVRRQLTICRLTARPLDRAPRFADHARMSNWRRFLPFSSIHALLAALMAVLPAPASGQVPRPSSGQTAAHTATAPSQAVPRTPKLVVLLVVDQFRADYVEKFGRQWTGGLRRLLTEGAGFREAAYPYLSTVTCVGHTTIVTGSLPSTHGIIGNSWWDREAGRTAGCVADPDQKLVAYSGRPVPGVSGRPVPAGTSTRNLRVPTLADEMRAQMPVPPRIVSISLKDYTATMMAGRRADAAAWFSPSAASWITTTAFTTTAVPFVAEFLKARPIDADYGKTWTKALPESEYLHQDEAPAEATDPWGVTFPHVLKGKGEVPDQAFYVEWDTSPFSDAYLAAMAANAVDVLKLGQAAGTDFLSISFSALDMVGHDFGPRSHEVQDVLAHLDRTLGRLLSHLDARVGKGRYVVALTGDHGVAPIPEQMTALGVSAGRLLVADVMRAANQALEDTMGPGAPKVARLASNDLYFGPGDWAKIAAMPDAVCALTDAIRALPGMARVFRGDELEGSPGPWADRLERAARASYFPGRSGDLILVPRPYWLYTTNPATSAGTGHGSAYDYDQRVPMVLMGQGIKPGQYLGAAGPMDIAPTLAFLCGITLPAADGRVLREALVGAR
jgi:predicted AlkP superfamily pyrophosphatase or phosphodiesterase